MRHKPALLLHQKHVATPLLYIIMYLCTLLFPSLTITRLAHTIFCIFYCWWFLASLRFGHYFILLLHLRCFFVVRGFLFGEILLSLFHLFVYINIFMWSELQSSWKWILNIVCHSTSYTSPFFAELVNRIFHLRPIQSNERSFRWSWLIRAVFSLDGLSSYIFSVFIYACCYTKLHQLSSFRSVNKK